MRTQVKSPIVKLPYETQTALFLIREELKARKLFHGLQEVGLSDCYFQPHLDILILRSVGLDDETDETFGLYEEIIERRSRKIDADIDCITRQAFKVYQELQHIKKLRKPKKSIE